MSTLFQAGTLVAFLQGIYDGDCTFEKLAKKGDLGLGTVNAVDGEMIALDGKFYRINANGDVNIIPSQQRTPFALVSKYKPLPSFKVENIPSLEALNQLIDEKIKTPNIFYMIRIDGEMEWIHLRSEHCQVRKYRPLAETLPKLQTEFELTHSQGTLVATRCPEYSAGFTIPGYHYHYIDVERKTGGHVFDLKIKAAHVVLNPIRNFTIKIYNTDEFDEANLDTDIFSALKKVEEADKG